MKNTLFLAVLLFSFLGLYAQNNLQPINEGSKVHFTIKNMGISTGGDLSNLKGTIFIQPLAPSNSKVDVTVDVSTIDTDNERRDRHLKSADFFDIAKFPTIRIVSTKIETTSTVGTYIFNGNLTIKDVTLPIKFPFSAVSNNSGYLFVGSFAINRLDFKIGKESATMGDEVKVELSVYAK